MKELTKSQKLDFIKQKVADLELTAYRLAEKTDLGEKGIKNILDGKVKSPHQSTVNSLYDYLKDLEKDKTRINSVEEPEQNYSGIEITADDVIARKMMQKVSPHLEEIKEQNNTIQRQLYIQSEALVDMKIQLEKFKGMLEAFRKSQEKIDDIHGVLSSSKE